MEDIVLLEGIDPVWDIDWAGYQWVVDIVLEIGKGNLDRQGQDNLDKRSDTVDNPAAARRVDMDKRLLEVVDIFVDQEGGEEPCLEV